MILLDSSCWIEFLMDGPRANAVEKLIGSPRGLLVPTVVLYEVRRHLLKGLGKREIIFATGQMAQGHVIPLDERTATLAASVSLEHNLGMADALIYSSCLVHSAKLVTLDNDFRKLRGCEVLS